MDQKERPSPDEILESIRKEEKQQTKGRLKIYLGMAAGVGKTYSMLEEAQVLRRVGVDVAIGIVDTHGREETEALLKDLKVIPQKLVSYKDKDFYELDLDAVINLKPSVVLVDELAHTNIPGLRHTKRWQDVLEILDHGIDVYSTLNIQHIESLNDVVKGISGISVRETVPDVIVETADSIRLVDISPDELLQRLKEGKIYLGDQSQIAALNFFQKDRLTALREIVLRYAAEKVDRDLLGLAASSVRVIEWKPREKFLIAISHSPTSQKLIRTGRRLAALVKAPWIALYVNTGKTLDEQDNNQLARNLLLARDLGAEVISINDPSISEGIQRIARQKAVTQIVLGRHPTRTFLGFLRRYNLFDNLILECQDIDIHIIKQERYSLNFQKRLLSRILPKSVKPYLIMVFYMAVLTFINFMLSSFLSYQVIGVILLIGLISGSLSFGVGPLILGALLYPIIMDVFFIPPVFELGDLTSEDKIVIFLYMISAIFIGIALDRSRRHKRMLLMREKMTDILLEVANLIAKGTSIPETCKTITDKLEKFIGGYFEVVIKEIDNGLIFDKPQIFFDDEKEKATATWVFEHNKEAGWTTDTLPSSQNLYIPLIGSYETVGVLVYRPKSNRVLSTEEKAFIITVSQQLASYVERFFSVQRDREHEQLKQMDKIHKSILDRLSKEFEKPINNLGGEIEKLKNTADSNVCNSNAIENAYHGIVKILLNISTMSQLSEGLVPIRKSLHDVKEFLEECCEDARSASSGHRFELKIEEKLPSVAFDDYLIRLLIYNVLNNAMEYSPPNSLIEVEAKMGKNYLIINVTDEGEGIPEEELENIFDKFYRLPEARTPGAGLGLAIAKTIAELHGGYLTAENILNKGTRFSLYLPL